MKKEIKFRCWHNTFEKPSMVYWKLGSGLDNSVFFSNAIDVMQYTGLKDENGKDIYDGDILNIEYDCWRVGEKGKTKRHCSEYYQIGWGVYDDDGIDIECFLAKSIGECSLGGDESLHILLFHCQHNSVVNGYWKSENVTYKIVGNRYENPELLKLTETK